MQLNRFRRLWFSADGEQWQPLGAGIKERISSKKQEKLLFYPLGREESPEEEGAYTVKVLTFLADLDADDEALLSLLELEGQELFLLEENWSKNPDTNAIFYAATLEVEEDGCGAANEPQQLRFSFRIRREQKGKISESVNGLRFTAYSSL